MSFSESSSRAAGQRTARSAAELRRFRRFTSVFYLFCATLFMTFYTVRTVWLMPWGIDGFTYDRSPYPFRYRVLVPFLARQLHALTGWPLYWLYAGLGTLAVWVGLLAYRRLLGRFMREDTARILAPALLYTMTWQYCAMNLMYFPFDPPSVLAMVAGWDLLLTRRWLGYYAVFAVAILNRETILILSLVFALVWFRRMGTRRLVLHLLAQLAIFAGVKALLFAVYASPESRLYLADKVARNWQTVHDIFTLRGNALKDTAKLLLSFGGLWAAVPLVWRDQPEAIRRSVWVVWPYFVAMWFVGTIDEMREYAELIPVLTTPALIWAARRLENGAETAARGPG